MLNFVTHVLPVILCWEAGKYIREQWQEASARHNGTRWECSHCSTVFSSNDPKMVMSLSDNHLRSAHNLPNDEGDEDA